MSEKRSVAHEGDNHPMMLTGRNLNHLMSRRNVDAETLSKQVGLGIATVNALRRGVGNPTLSTLLSLAGYFGVSLSELTEIDLTQDQSRPGPVKTVPLVRLNEVCSFLEQRLKKIQTYTTEIEGDENANYFAVALNNDALAPHLPAGTILIIARGEELCDGDVVLVRLGLHPCLRRVFIDGEKRLFSTVSHEKEISPTVYPEHEVIGVALKAIKPI